MALPHDVSSGREAPRTSLAGRRTPTLALMSVGMARTMLHPAVVESFNAMRTSLLADGLSTKTFFYVSSLGVPDNTTAWRAAVQRRYRPAAIWEANEDLPCNRQCLDVTCYKASAPAFFQQFHKLKHAWDALGIWESRHSVVFDWILRLRPDLLFLEPIRIVSPLRMLDALPTDAVYVPEGVMASSRKHHLLNDHVLLCPRRLCSPYFTDVSSKYSKCDDKRPMRLPYPPQLLVFNRTCGRGHTCHRRSRLFQIAYTIARANGPECSRLFTAWHLHDFVHRCRLLELYWKDFGRNFDMWATIIQSLLLGKPEQIQGMWDAYATRLENMAANVQTS
eukprot:TRINITY_DN27350_c0_g1_i1.p1 TRINITY_DN27350_c0_g1~~TRINITY_DN27350_c0_g1_i1.p1  ORF type:complete len:349 (+),score=25.60 TRINITY_DN27350_c0_g1_i1:45-1049(+)